MHPRFFGVVRAAYLFSFFVFSYYVSTFWVSCCDVCYDFRLKTMFGSSLPPVVCMWAHVLVTLFVFVCCLRIVVSNTYCVVFLFCFSPSCVPKCCQFLWIVHSWLPLWYSLTFNYNFPPYLRKFRNCKLTEEIWVDKFYT
jgi:hypothetical protein